MSLYWNKNVNYNVASYKFLRNLIIKRKLTVDDKTYANVLAVIQCL